MRKDRCACYWRTAGSQCILCLAPFLLVFPYSLETSNYASIPIIKKYTLYHRSRKRFFLYVLLCVVLETSWNDSFFIFPCQHHISFDGIVAVWSVKLCLKDQLTARADFQFFPKAPKSQRHLFIFLIFLISFFYV
jgi:hypothetical protein